MVLHAAWKMDTEGKRAARQDISMIKVIAAQMHQRVLDRAMQVHGALGMSDDTPLAAAWRQGRWLRIADGPGRGAQDGDRAARAEPLQAAASRSRLEHAVATLTPRPTAASPTSSAPSSRRSATSPRARSFERPERGRPLGRGRRPHGRARLVRAADPRGVRRLRRQFLDATLFLEESARGQIPVAGYGVTLIVVGALNRFGTEEQKRDLFGRVVEGRRRSPSRCPSPRPAPTWPP